MSIKIKKVYISVLFSAILISCTGAQIAYVSQPKIPANLLADCLPPVLPEKLTFGKSIVYNEKLLKVIEACNADKQAIRKMN